MELTTKQILVLISNIHLLLPVTAIMGPIKFQPCEQNALHFTDRCHYLSDCVDGHCECSKHSIRLVYNKNGEGFCEQQNKKNDEPCAEGSVRVLNNTGIVTYCAEVHYQNPLDQCHVELDKAYLCDPKAMTYCSNKKCKCFDGFKYNFNSTKCEKNEKGEKSYVDQYCDDKGQCVEGLTCSQSIMQCKCPSPCVYLEDKAVCDCGKLDFPTPVGVTVTGVILSIMSVIFWSCLINKTINYPKRPDELNNEEPTEMDAPLDHSRYSPSVQLQPIQTPHDNIPSNDLPPSYNQVIAESSPAVGWSNIPKHNDSELPSYSLPLKTADSNLPYQLSPSIPEPNPSPFQPNPSPFQPNPSPFQPNPSHSQPNPLPHQLNPSAPQMNK